LEFNMSMVEPRFAVEKSIKFRSHGSVQWHPGQTRNLSRSGLLFTCDEDLAVGSVVELVLLDQDLNGHSAEGRPCHAEVVRRVLMAWPDIGVLVGARFLD
jgi:PilZ domain